MALPDDLITYHSTNRPTVDGSTVGGAIDTGSGPVSQTTLNVLFPSTPTNPFGGLDIVHRYKLHRKNTNATTVGGPPRFWILNGVLENAVAGKVTVVVTGADTGKVRIVGFVGGVPDYEDIDIAGAGSYVGLKDFDVGGVWRAERLSAGGVLVPAVAEIQIWRGSQLGIIPAPGTVVGYGTATKEFELWVEPTIGSTLTSTSRTADPAGASFQKPYQEGTALLIDVGTSIAQNEDASYWLRRTYKAGLQKPVDFVFPIVRCKFAA